MKEEKDKEMENQETLEARENVEKEEKTEANEEAQEEPSLEDQLGEAKDKYLRLYSEFENFRRRTSKERLDLISTANRDLMSEVLPVLDDFERAMSSSSESENYKAFKEGMGLIQSKLNKVLENKGLKQMGVKKGDKFDDEMHEAITQIPAEKKLEGKIVDVVEPGYYLGEVVVRFAKVVVGAKK